MSRSRMILVAALLLLVGGALACTGESQKPTVEILSPPSGTQVAVGEKVQVEYRASDANAVARVDLEVGGQVVDSQNSPVADGQPTMTGVLTWSPEESGEYTLVVFAYNSDRVASDPVGVNVTVGDAGAVPGSTVTISLLLPGSTRTPGSTETVQPTQATATATGPSSAPTTSATRPPAAPTATSTTPPPTPTQRQAAAPPPPPTATATKPPPSPTPTTELANLWVENFTSVDICEVYFSRPADPWGSNRLLAGNRIYAGQSALWTVPPGNYDLWALDCVGNGLVVLSNQPVYGDWVWEIYPALPPPPPPTEPITVGVYNHCSEAIGGLYIYRPSDPTNGPNQVQGYSIPAGGSQFFGIESGVWAIDAYNVGGYWLDSMPPTDFPPGTDPMWNACASG
jgi:hypothetical protein